MGRPPRDAAGLRAVRPAAPAGSLHVPRPPRVPAGREAAIKSPPAKPEGFFVKKGGRDFRTTGVKDSSPFSSKAQIKHVETDQQNQRAHDRRKDFAQFSVRPAARELPHKADRGPRGHGESAVPHRIKKQQQRASQGAALSGDDRQQDDQDRRGARGGEDAGQNSGEEGPQKAAFPVRGDEIARRD